MIEHRKTSVTYRGDGVTTSFPFSFDISSADTIRVAIYDTATEITTEITRDYFVDVSAKVVHYPGYAPGQAPAAAAQPPKLPNGKTITIYRKTPINQLTNLGTKHPLPSIEAMADKVTAIVQEHDEVLGRTVTLPAGDPKTPEQRLTDMQTYVLNAKNAASAADQSARSAGDSKASAANSASSSAQSATASEASRQASAESESKIKNMQVDVHAMQQHVDEVKTTVEALASRAAADGQTALGAAEQALHSKESCAQSATASEASAKRAEQAAKFEGVVKSENLAEKSVHKKHLLFEVYDKGEVDSRINTKVSKSGDTMTGTLRFTNEGTVLRGIVSDNDFWRLFAGREGGGSNAGYLTLDTADDGAEGIFVRQFTGDFQNEVRYAKLLGDDGTSSFPVSVTAPKFIASNGGFEGTATNSNRLENWTLQNILDEFLNIWHANRAYAVGDIADHKNLPSRARLECVIAGTTGNNANIFSKNMKAGQYIQDGGVKWIVDDMRDCNRVGSITGSLYLPDGYVKANGATVQRADYPRLVTLADRYNLWTNDTVNNLGLFGRGDGSRTMVLPNYTDRMIQFAANSIGTSVSAGLPNITGTTVDGFVMGYIDGSKTATGTGAITVNTVDRTSSYGTGPATRSTVGIDASRSNSIYGRSSTVQPAAIRLIPIIRY